MTKSEVVVPRGEWCEWPILLYLGVDYEWWLWLGCPDCGKPLGSIRVTDPTEFEMFCGGACWYEAVVPVKGASVRVRVEENSDRVSEWLSVWLHGHHTVSDIEVIVDES